MPKFFHVVGDDITVDGEVVGSILPTIHPTMAQDIRDSLNGMVLYDHNQEAAREAKKDEEEELEERRVEELAELQKQLQELSNLLEQAKVSFEEKRDETTGQLNKLRRERD